MKLLRAAVNLPRRVLGRIFSVPYSHISDRVSEAGQRAMFDSQIRGGF